MVAPTRTPQARGVKCDLCKKILALATWLDQTKLAKEVEEAQMVLNIVKQHQKTECPCIPKNIENLLVGSTHFEIHRLVAKKLDSQIHKRQSEHFNETKQKKLNQLSKNRNEIINDCYDTSKESRFKVYFGYNNQEHCERSKQQLRHLCRAIDYWRNAMEDQANPFNSKLALRLGLTHHVIYACYLFKFYKVLDYQLLTANLLLNLFKSIEGVTANAILHANYLLIKTLMDCDQLQLARQYLKQATKSSNYQEKSHYEAILLTCAECELNLLEGNDLYSIFDELTELVVIKADDKLQHYYARTLAMSLIIKYIHCYPAKSDQCFEFYHTFRYTSAIIRRCYEDSFWLVLAEKDSVQHQPSDPNQSQILDHSWIRFAVCDFVYTTFDLLCEFYIRAGMPESLELLYNGLNLIAFRAGSIYWQSRMVAIGARLDLLCDKYEHARVKLDILSSIVGYTNDPYLMNLLRLESEVGLLSILNQEEAVINKDVILDLLRRIKTCKNSLIDRLSQIELYDSKSDTNFKIVNNFDMESSLIVLGNCLGKLSLMVLKIGLVLLLREGNVTEARNLIGIFCSQLGTNNLKVLEYYECQHLLEILIQFIDIDKSEQILLETLSTSNLFLEADDKISTIQSQLSTLTLNSEPEKTNNGNVPQNRRKPIRNKSSKTSKTHRISLKRSRRKGTYEVAIRSEENLGDAQIVRLYDIMGTITNFSSLSKEELVVSYLRNSEPNPDYLLYRRAHELMLSFRLLDSHYNHDQLLYHFCESSTTNTMRYRWMMFEEQLSSPYNPPKSSTGNENVTDNIKHLGFSNSLANSEKTIRLMTRGIPDEFKLLQFKYILDKQNKTEHLISCCFDGNSTNDPIYVHAKRSIVASDDFFEDAKELEKNFEKFALPNRLSKKIEDSRKTLFNNNQRSRSEMRQRIETDIGLLLHDIENDWLGPFRFLMCGKICNVNYNKFISELVDEMQSIMKDHPCSSVVALRSFMENAPLLNREEFCQVISMLFNCSPKDCETRECFNKWLKSVEAFVNEHSQNLNKTTFLQTLTRGQLGLILDNKLELIPFESLPVVRIAKQGIFRVPSLRIFSILANRNCTPIKVDTSELAYMLDPAGNLGKTRERFDNKLRSQKCWSGTIGQAPKTEQLEEWLAEKQIYIFIGHGAGTTYYNKLCKGRGLSAMDHVRSVSVVMGCSSGRLLAEGSRLESFGISWVFIFRGAPCYVGLLWDVTDTDIDRFLDSMLAKWMPYRWSVEETLNQVSDTSTSRPSASLSITDASAQARHVCQFKFLVGSTPVVYGLPVWCSN